MAIGTFHTGKAVYTIFDRAVRGRRQATQFLLLVQGNDTRNK